MNRTILKVEGRLTPSCSKTHVEYRFTVERPLTRMDIGFSYAPKTLADEGRARELIVEGAKRFGGEEVEALIADWRSNLPLANLLTVSIDDPALFRGCAHRSAPIQNLFIADSDASHGFVPGVLPAGQWKVTVSAHAVVTEACEYEIDILGQTK